MKFDEPTLERPHPICKEGGNGTQKIWRFKNGFGASVVQFSLPMCFGSGSYTNNESEWELAVIKFKGKDIDSFNIVYNTKITSDVMGHLIEEEVIEILKKIEKLK